MSSRKAAAAKPGSKTKTAAAAPAPASEPTSAEKAAFLKAMAKGITPDTKAARKVAEKSAGTSAEPPKVEVLRRIPAQPKVESTPESLEALRLASMIEKALEDGQLQAIQPHAQQALMAALCKLYAANAEAGDRFPALGMRSAVTATDVMIVCGALLKAVDLQVFELGMWQSWSAG